MKTNLRKLDWAEIIIYFLDIKERYSKPKDLVDYFHFKYLTGVGLNRWTNPNYITQSKCAEKIIDLYGVNFTIDLIDLLFKDYKEIFNKEFMEIRWSLGILSSDKTGWIFEKLLTKYNNSQKQDINSQILKLMEKERRNWTHEDFEKFDKLIKQRGEQNGKS